VEQVAVSDPETNERLAAVEQRLAKIQALLRWGVIGNYFAIAWIVVPALAYRWTGWHILGWWGMASLILGIVLDHYCREWFDSWRPK